MSEKLIDVSMLTQEQKDALLHELQSDRNTRMQKRREAYETLKADFVKSISARILTMSDDVKALFDFVVKECGVFYEVMKEYAQLRNEGQLNYKVEHDNFKIEVKSNKVKGFDERANVAASRLIEFLQGWIDGSDRGTDDPMYQLAMTLLERNRYGDFDYKSISKLYDMEQKFNNAEYSDIMQLFKESNTIEGTATNFYFSQKDTLGVWRKIEINFNRL
ncbi:DUF3164 family protein [Dysgonomonas termitidis]|uniref:DUF3164 family protein n=1 Tax=Dysgonomonas termitidis TaxID=1516126 RepID=A0ABV9KVG7_9BACT